MSEGKDRFAEMTLGKRAKEGGKAAMYLKCLQRGKKCPLKWLKGNDLAVFSLVYFRTRLHQITTLKKIAGLLNLHERGAGWRSVQRLNSAGLIVRTGQGWTTSEIPPDVVRRDKRGIPTTTPIPFPSKECPHDWQELIFLYTVRIIRRPSVKGLARLLGLEEA